MRHVRGKNWTQIDRDTFPLVKDTILKLKGDDISRPKRITISLVERTLNLPCKRISYLPMCKEEIQKHYETQEQYWAREVVWAVNKLKREGVPVTKYRIKRLTNMREENLQACMPYLTVNNEWN